ncbi:uncharacterized protein BX663DRAFT_551578 [Cokeromyces recurvatus]|uniref:uncharacterized protein n=1 Tax=Cokeromyces recurvatus TaxID=90255 RepID=UPI00221EF458|nr:uncharacterized protein BX663DRAFT_551578 [Cokeromyces recurvatus]KAI7903282.1 hypothetical protein BX663DRAFT_551578 [Cokeromyces recurvatus]
MNNDDDIFQAAEYYNAFMMNLSSINPTAKATLWMGDLDHWMDEHFLKELWAAYGEEVTVKLIRDKRTDISGGYAFIEFTSTYAAQKALATIHGTRIPNSLKTFKLNWASGGGICDRKEDRTPEYSLFIGDLSQEMNETFLLSFFRVRYPSCHSAKIMTDPLTGLSKGYGFVRFLNQLEQQQAVIEMNGVICNNRPIRVSFATPKSNYHTSPIFIPNHHTRYMQLALQAPALVNQPTDPNNTTVFVGGLLSPITEQELAQYFAPFGDIVYVKIPPGKGCGFVQYVSRISAEQAIERMNGFLIGHSRIRLSWGRSNKKSINSESTSPSSSSTSSSLNTTMMLRSLSPPSSIFSSSSIYDSQSSTHNLLFRSSSMYNHDWILLQQQKQDNDDDNNLFYY